MLDLEPLYRLVSLFPFECLQAGFMQQALVALILLAPMAATMGVQVVSFRMAFFSDAISHSAFAGVALGLIFSINPHVAMPVFGILVGRAFREDMPLEADDVRGVVEDHAEIMADHKLRESLGGAQFVQQFAEQMLSLKIHPGRGLVEHEQFRFLLQGKRQQDALHFAAGQIAKPPGSEVFRLDH